MGRKLKGLEWIALVDIFRPNMERGSLGLLPSGSGGEMFSLAYQGRCGDLNMNNQRDFEGTVGLRSDMGLKATGM